MSGLNKREKWFIAVALTICVAIIAIVVMLFLQLGEEPTLQGEATPTVQPTISAGPTMTPIPSDVIVVPGTDAPVFFGVSSSISVDCVNPLYVKQQVVDRFFYLGYMENVDYTVTETEACIVVRLKVETNKETFAALYAQMLTLIYDCNVNQHLENGVSVDKNGIESDDTYSYLTMYFYSVE